MELTLDRHLLSRQIHEEEVLRLGVMGYAAIPLDFPAKIKFTREQRALMDDGDYRPDYLIFLRHPAHSSWPIAFWEVQVRIQKDPEWNDAYWMLTDRKLRKYKAWKEEYGLPFYVSVHFGRSWMGYQEISKLEILKAIESWKRGYQEVWHHVSLQCLTNTPLQPLPSTQNPKSIFNLTDLM